MSAVYEGSFFEHFTKMYIPSVWKYTDGYAILGREGKFLELGK